MGQFSLIATVLSPNFRSLRNSVHFHIYGSGEFFGPPLLGRLCLTDRSRKKTGKEGKGEMYCSANLFLPRGDRKRVLTFRYLAKNSGSRSQHIGGKPLRGESVVRKEEEEENGLLCTHPELSDLEDKKKFP